MTRFALMCALALPLLASAGEKKEIPVGGSDAVVLELRDGWREEAAATPGTIAARLGDRLQVLVTAAAARAGEESLQKIVEGAAAQVGPQSVEKTLEVKPLDGADARGSYFAATDPAPAPGEFRHMRQGMVAVGGARVTFTVLFNDGAERDADDAMASIGAMRFAPRTQPMPASGVEQGASELRLSMPMMKPGVSIPPEDWSVDEQKRGANSSAHYLLTSQRRKLVFSVHFDKAAACKSADECLDAVLKNPRYAKAVALQKSDYGPFKVARFFLDQPAGVPLMQAHVIASAFVDGMWVDVHLSRTEQQRPDMGTLLDFLPLISLK